MRILVFFHLSLLATIIILLQNKSFWLYLPLIGMAIRQLNQENSVHNADQT